MKERYPLVERAMLARYGVRVRKWRQSTSGVAWSVLYRDGIATRTLTAKGTRLSPTCEQRHAGDPRGKDGPVHEKPFQAEIWQDLVEAD